MQRLLTLELCLRKAGIGQNRTFAKPSDATMPVTRRDLGTVNIQNSSRIDNTGERLWLPPHFMPAFGR